jgi:hypothetical protein
MKRRFNPDPSKVKTANYPSLKFSALFMYFPILSYKISDTSVRSRLCTLQKGCTQLATASDKGYQLLAHGRWLSPGTPASSTNKTGRHDIAEVLLKVALNTKNLNPQYRK